MRWLLDFAPFASWRKASTAWSKESIQPPRASTKGLTRRKFSSGLFCIVSFIGWRRNIFSAIKSSTVAFDKKGSSLTTAGIVSHSGLLSCMKVPP